MKEAHLEFASVKQRDEVLSALEQRIDSLPKEETTDELRILSDIGSQLSFAVHREVNEPRRTFSLIFETDHCYAQCVSTLKSSTNPNLKWLGHNLEFQLSSDDYQTPIKSV